MNVNATLFVQAINFVIVYWMLRLFLFKPIVTIIEHEKSQENAMLDIIDQQKKSLEIQEKERQRYWYTCQEYFLLHQPDLSQKTSFFLDATEDDGEPSPVVSPDTISTMITNTHDLLEEKIKHVR